MASTPQHLGIHRLEGFFWVARTGGYARAARAFPYPITQPAVHQQVKKLEDELAVTLFERVAKDRMALTPAGQRLFDFVRPFFESLPSVIRSVRGGEFGGTLRVSSSSLLLRRLIPAWVQRLHAEHPSIEIHLEETGDDAPALLRQGAVDLAIDHLYETPDDIATMKVAALRPYVVLPEQHAQPEDEPVNLAALATLPFVAYSQPRARELQFMALGQHDVSPVSTLSGSSAETILGFIAAGLGWSILPWLAGDEPASEAVQSRPLPSPTAELDIVAAWRKDCPENPLLDAMLEAAPRA
ncbi:MAG: LysR family transcriptional regulator [Planctomycetes bacterium]|nr:LysR family transcriptional regulator [Planctomycetota bacterium]